MNYASRLAMISQPKPSKPLGRRSVRIGEKKPNRKPAYKPLTSDIAITTDVATDTETDNDQFPVLLSSSSGVCTCCEELLDLCQTIRSQQIVVGNLQRQLEFVVIFGHR
jgi:hypothetical protein